MLRPTGLGPLLILALVLFAASSSPDRAVTASLPAQHWLAYGHDAQQTNFVRSPGLTSATAKTLREVWTKKLDGPVIA